MSVESPVVILGDLIAQNAIEGKQAVLEVEVTGSLPISYTWYYGGSKISGANGPKLEFGSVNLSDQGKYSVIVSNNAGGVLNSVSSSDVLIYVVSPPVITSQSDNKILNEGSTLSLQVGVSGSEPLSVNWFKGVSNVGEGTLLVKEDISLTDSGFYYVEVSNDAGTIRGDLIEVQLRQPVEVV